MAARFQSGSPGSKSMAPAASTPVETVTMARAASITPLGVVTLIPAPPQSMRSAAQLSSTGRPAKWAATSDP